MAGLGRATAVSGLMRGADRLDGFLHSGALTLMLLLPWFLLHARAGAEIAIDAVGALFVLHCALRRSWVWLRQPWVILALAWWAWLVGCTVLHVAVARQDGASLVQAVLLGRFLLFVAAVQVWVLRDGRARRWFFASLALTTAYVAAQTLLQFVTGSNAFGAPRSGDGELTGPFDKPRDAPTFVRMLFPVLLPPVGMLLARPRWLPRLAGLLLLAGAMATLILIGQRMPVLLGALGLLVAGLLLRRLRGPAVLTLAAGVVLVAASAAVSPPAFQRLVTKFSDQMGHFATSPYGLVAERAVAVAEQHPWTGRGFDGYRTGCPDPRYFQAWHWPGSPAEPDPIGAALCLTHTHNLFLQAASDAGLPGLVLFGGLAVTWLALLGRGLLRQPDPLRAGLFIAILLQLWPIASTSPLTTLPIGGWFFLLLGAGLAQRPAAPLP